MQRHLVPYGEARRLRYFTHICSQLLQSQSVDIDLLIDRLMSSVAEINPKLKLYIRQTGIMQSRQVTRNYLKFAAWLDFVRFDRSLVVPNGYTVLFANLGPRDDFLLTDIEKVGFFLHLIQLDELRKLLSSLKMKDNAMWGHMLGLSEHFVESYFEWLVDLGILKPTSPKFGHFALTNLGYHVRESIKDEQDPTKVSLTYASRLLGTSVEVDLSIPDDDIWTSFEKSLNKLSQYTRSEVDSDQYSVFPLILDLQIELVFDRHVLVTRPLLIQKLRDISAYHNAVFMWDPLADAGYLKIGG